jgi:hypothetical protein
MMGYDLYGIFGGMGIGMVLWIPLVALVVWALARLVWRVATGPPQAALRPGRDQ